MNRKLSSFLLTAAFPACVVTAQQPPATSASPAPAQTSQAPATQQPATQQPATQQPTTQQPGAPVTDQSQDTGPILHLNANEVNLIFTVTDKHGHYVPDLK